jgi:streptogramin lyase
MNDQKIYRWLRSIAALMLAAIGIGVLLVNAPAARSISAHIADSPPAVQSSFLYRFDPNSQTWFTYTLPIGSLPSSVVTTGTNPTHVWIAEYGLNKIGHLIYTDTNHISFIEYPVTSTVNSQPFRLTLNGNYVWFTERGANRVGRLDATSGQIDEFYGQGLSANSGLADIKVAPNGWVWIAGQWSDRFIRLVVTSTLTYNFSQYSNYAVTGPFGVSIESENAIWFSAPSAHRIGRFTPSDGSFISPPPQSGSLPEDIIYTASGNFVWFSDFGRNAIGQFQIGTYPFPKTFTSTIQPFGLASQSPNIFWITEQSAQGTIARFVYTSTTSAYFDHYALPLAGLFPTEIDVATDSSIWLTAYRAARIYLPLVAKNY